MEIRIPADTLRVGATLRLHASFTIGGRPRAVRVFVYRNLRMHCWSLRDLVTRRVIGHAETVTLVDVVPKVSAAGRARVLRERQKNVHAGLVGTLVDPMGAVPDEAQAWGRLTYDPYRAGAFTTAADPYLPLRGPWPVAVLGTDGVRVRGIPARDLPVGASFVFTRDDRRPLPVRRVLGEGRCCAAEDYAELSRIDVETGTPDQRRRCLVLEDETNVLVLADPLPDDGMAP